MEFKWIKVAVSTLEACIIIVNHQTSLSTNQQKSFNRWTNLIRQTLLSLMGTLEEFETRISTLLGSHKKRGTKWLYITSHFKADWHPIIFKSRWCTSAEKKCCFWESETLAIVFTCSKFNEYLYGKKFIAERDHKRLKSILNTPMHTTRPRIQRFIMFLEKYDSVVNYVPGKDLIWEKVFKNGTSNICGRQPLKNCYTLNTLFHLLRHFK